MWPRHLCERLLRLPLAISSSTRRATAHNTLSLEIFPAERQKQMYSFRIRLRTAKGFTTDDQRLSISFQGGREANLAAIPSSASLKEARWLDVRSTGYTTLEEATLAAEKLRKTLLLAGTIGWMGFDFGLDRASSALSEELRALLEGYQANRIRDSIHGVDVYEEEEGRETRFIEMSAVGFVTASPSTFTETIKNVESKADDLSTAQIISMHLLNDSIFQPSSDSQLLTRVTSMEVLCERNRRSAPVVQALEQFAKAADELALGDEDRDALKTLLLNGKKESIGDACRRHVGALLGKDKIDAFDRIYKARSSLVHAGKGRGTTAEIADEALRFATDLIKADIGLLSLLQ